MKRRILLATSLAISVPVLLAASTWWLTGHITTRNLPPIREEAARFEREGLRPEELPPEWLEVLLRVEDPAFHEHSGVDLETPGAGLTTITQGLAKRYCFDEFRPGVLNKLLQTFAAIRLDRALSKRTQLLLVLNTAGLGPGKSGWAEGFPAAAREYYSKPVGDLSTDGFTTLVAMLVGPSGVRDVYYHTCGGL